MLAISTSSKHSWNVFLLTCICFMQGKCWCMWTKSIINTLRNPNLVLALMLLKSQLHITSFWGVWFAHAQWRPYSSQANSDHWKNPINNEVQWERVHYPRQNALFNCHGTRLAEGRKSLAALNSFVSKLFLFLIINLFGKRCHACLKLKKWYYDDMCTRLFLM